MLFEYITHSKKMNVLKRRLILFLKIFTRFGDKTIIVEMFQLLKSSCIV